MSRTQRMVMIEPDNTRLSRKRQCELLDISRSSTYYQPKGTSKRDLKLMRAIDEQYLKTPYTAEGGCVLPSKGKDIW